MLENINGFIFDFQVYDFNFRPFPNIMEWTRRLKRELSYYRDVNEIPLLQFKFWYRPFVDSDGEETPNPLLDTISRKTRLWRNETDSSAHFRPLLLHLRKNLYLSVVQFFLLICGKGNTGMKKCICPFRTACEKAKLKLDYYILYSNKQYPF